MADEETEFFCGAARLPKEMASAGPSGYLFVEIAVDMPRNVVVDVACTGWPRSCGSLVLTTLPGKDPVEGAAEARSIIENRYHGLGKNAMLHALQNAIQEYLSWREGRGP